MSIILLLLLVFMSSCVRQEAHEGGELNGKVEKESENQQENREEREHCKSIAGRYESKEGDLKIARTEGMVLFDLLVVADSGRTGTLTGQMSLEKCMGVYENQSQNCHLKFMFADKQVKVVQQGDCEMGMGVNVSGLYRSMNDQDAALVMGKVGDRLETLPFGKSRTEYEKHCWAGMEEESGNIVCEAMNRGNPPEKRYRSEVEFSDNG